MKKRGYLFPFSYLLIFVVSWFQPLPVLAQQSHPNILVIEGGTLIDGNGGPDRKSTRLNSSH